MLELIHIFESTRLQWVLRFTEINKLCLHAFLKVVECKLYLIMTHLVFSTPNSSFVMSMFKFAVNHEHTMRCEQVEFIVLLKES